MELDKSKNGPYSLGFFFTLGVSLQTWDKAGILDREIKLYNILAGYFNKIYFFSYGNKKELSYSSRLAKNIKVIYKKFPAPDFIYSLLIPFLNYRLIKNCHLLKTNQMLGSWSAVLAKALFGNKLVVRTGFTWSKNYNQKKASIFKRIIMLNTIRLLEKTAFFLSDLAIVTSHYDKRYLLTNYRLNGNKVRIIHNYIDTEIFKPLNEKKYKNRIVFVGRIAVEKNLPMLIEAIKGSEICLDIIGIGPLQGDILKLARETKVRVNFLGVIPNNKLPVILNKYPVFVLPSLYEGHPKSLLEAMSCGLACIGSDVSGIDEVIDDSVNGILVKTDAESIRQGILKLLNDSKLREWLGQNARKKVIDEYSLEKIIEQELWVYGQLLG